MLNLTDQLVHFVLLIFSDIYVVMKLFLFLVLPKSQNIEASYKLCQWR